MKRKDFIVFGDSGVILSTGSCLEDSFDAQASGYENAHVIEGVANQDTQKIIEGKIVNKTPSEIEASRPETAPDVLFEDQRASITNREYQQLLDRVSNLENN